MRREDTKVTVSVEELQKMRAQGLTLREIGEKFGVSRQRIDQILKKETKVSSPYISTSQLANISHCTKETILWLEKEGLVKPVRVVPAGKLTRKLWENNSLEGMIRGRSTTS